MTKHLIIFYFSFIISNFSFGQKSVELIEKYGKPEILAYCFTNGSSTESLSFYNSFERLNNNPQFERLEIEFYNKNIRQGTEKITYTDDKLVKSTFRHSFWTIPKRTYYFIEYLPSKMLYIFQKRKIVADQVKIERDSLGQIIATRHGNWTEEYIYDSISNLIVIHVRFNPNNQDGSHTLFCASTVNKWEGKYEKGNIIEETITWDTGKMESIRHNWENGLLLESIKKSPYENGNMTIRYCYNNNSILSRIEYYSNKGILVSVKKFNWRNKNNT